MKDSNRTVRWGILGTARIAEKISIAIHQAENAELTCIASRDSQRAADWAQKHHVKRSVGSYEALLADSEIDAVYIPLPPSLHGEWTVRAARAGKHVLCEKPLALNVNQAREMRRVCLENQVQLMDGVMWYHHPRAREILQKIRSDALGEHRRFTSAFTICWDNIPENDLRLQRDLGGGSLGDLGWYCIGATLWAFNELPQKVFGTSRSYEDNDVDYNFSGTMWFSKDRIASFDCGFDVCMRKWFEIAGTKASLVCNDFTRPWDNGRPKFFINDAQGNSIKYETEDPLQETCMINHFCDIIRSGRLEQQWSDLGINTQRVLNAIDYSARTEQVVNLADFFPQ
ncbi:Gfo/Idh/MocA family protein [Gimesia aquarii]|uniref:1,5-anhydro-D-fructose reductase n=1 Tax=Gimesia aquarii TaxID=2527964 RepID=A0A517VV82_9PLAN|nr:Gfo/Idh/MocA family oxidoreductase [Gimesia aquarii]QDT96907.1 1,5-anhydro-D-fructose reductase [Gimesia aquarii]